MKWFNYIEYVNIDTGQLLLSEDIKPFEKEYRVIKKELKEIDELRCVRYYTKYVRKISEQLKIF